MEAYIFDFKIHTTINKKFLKVNLFFSNLKDCTQKVHQKICPERKNKIDLKKRLHLVGFHDRPSESYIFWVGQDQRVRFTFVGRNSNQPYHKPCGSIK